MLLLLFSLKQWTTKCNAGTPETVRDIRRAKDKTLMKSQARIIPDLYQQDQVIKKVNSEDNPATEEDDGRETMFETIHKFTEGRRAYKKKIIADVMAAAFPNMEGYICTSRSQSFLRVSYCLTHRCSALLANFKIHVLCMRVPVRVIMRFRLQCGRVCGRAQNITQAQQMCSVGTVLFYTTLMCYLLLVRACSLPLDCLSVCMSLHPWPCLLACI